MRINEKCIEICENKTFFSKKLSNHKKIINFTDSALNRYKDIRKTELNQRWEVQPSRIRDKIEWMIEKSSTKASIPAYFRDILIKDYAVTKAHGEIEP